jgi:hypothetical protein
VEIFLLGRKKICSMKTDPEGSPTLVSKICDKDL